MFLSFHHATKMPNVRGASDCHPPEAYSHSGAHVMPGALGSRLESANIVFFLKMQNSLCTDQASCSLPDYHWPLHGQKVVDFCWQRGGTNNPPVLSHMTKVKTQLSKSQRFMEVLVSIKPSTWNSGNL